MSPGQLEVLGRAGQGRTVLLLTHHLHTSQLALLCLALAHKVHLPSPLPPVLVPGLGDSWTERLLVRAGLASPYREDLLRQGELRGLRGLILTEFDAELVASLRDRGLELLLVPVLLCHEAGRGGESVRVELGQPLSLELVERGGWGLGQLEQHLSATSQRMFRVSPAQLVAFVLQTAHCPRNSSLARLCEACQDLLEVLNIKKVEISETGELADLVRRGVAVLGGHIDQDDRVEIPLSDLQLWRLCRGVEGRIMPECLISVVVLGLARPGLATTRTRHGPTVRQEELLERTESLALLTGLQSSLAPCEELAQVVVSALDTLHLLDCLRPVKFSPASQYGVRRRGGKVYRSSQNTEDHEERAVTCTTLTVGETARARGIIKWLGGVLRYKLTNLGYTTRALQSVREMKVVTMEEISDRVRDEIETKRSRGWKLSEKASVPEVTRDSLEALALVEVVNINMPGYQVEVSQTFDSSRALQEMINLVLEF